MKRQKTNDVNWQEVTTFHNLAKQLLRLAVRMEQVPRNTHILNWRAEPENEEFVEATWKEWRNDFPEMLLQNQLRKLEKKNEYKERRKANKK